MRYPIYCIVVVICFLLVGCSKSDEVKNQPGAIAPEKVAPLTTDQQQKVRSDPAAQMGNKGGAGMPGDK